MPGYTPHQAKFFAHYVTREGIGVEDGLAQSLSAARVDLNPHQVDAAMFALRSPLSKGVLLADEVGLGKTIEAALVITQRWWEGRRRLLLIAPASLRKQWQQELWEKFSLPSVILDAKRVRELQKAGDARPLERTDGIVILSYEYGSRVAAELHAIRWDLVVMDEAHKLRNVYRAAEGSRSSVLRAALADRQKLLLTATPLQNNLMELYGLLSMIDEHFFGSPDAFRAEFGRSDAGTLAVLGRRLEPICKRTLRRQVQQAGLINYTKRMAETFDFTPSALERKLYKQMSEYLQREDTLAIGKTGRHLVTLVLRKILGSSSFAVAATLDKMVTRLERKLEVGEETLDDYDGVEETAETWREVGGDAEADALEADEAEAVKGADPALLRAEIEELRGFRDLATSIDDNAKGRALVGSLPGVLREIEDKGGQRKAVIFTESVRTQRYLRNLLEANGFAGQTVLLNGANTDPESQALYKAWLAKHAGNSNVVSKTKSADMKAAIVDAFRNDRTILIATESGAEGINLQFCSLLINYDLPWNPQRVEQRIGRCHRYGQKIDVTVVNMMNRGNHAEARIVELLASKFNLFSGVFGSSDEVLGAIESGVDIEKRILGIVQSCRSNAEIDRAFEALQMDLFVEIDEAKTKAREAILAELDDKVVARLKMQQGAIHQQLGDFKAALLRLARAELPDAQFHADHAERFDHDGATYTTEWPVSEERGWRFYRLGDGELATKLADRAMDRDLASATLAFDLDAYPGKLADVELLRGYGGWLATARLTLDTPAKRYDDLIVVALTDDGGVVPRETAERLMQVPATAGQADGAGPPANLDGLIADAQTALVGAAQARLGDFLDEEETRLTHWQEDARVSYETKIKALGKEAKEKDKLARASVSLPEKVALQREAASLRRESDDLNHQLYTRLKEIDAERNRMLDEIAERLNLTPKLTPLFSARWSLAA